MVRKARPWWRNDRFTERDYQPYVIAIGQLALAWNDLHEKLGSIFVVVMEGNTADDNEDKLYQIAAVWSAVNNDRTKREMLDAAVKNTPELGYGPFPKLADDIKWLLARTTALEDTRNDIIHAPLVAFRGSLAKSLFPTLPVVIPNLLLRNFRAGKLTKKNPTGPLSDDFRWCRDSILTLRDYAVGLQLGLTVEGRPWPDRPQLQNRGQKKKLPRQPRQPALK
jgi:hypothetical protein